jgi:hypothetical protein
MNPNPLSVSRLIVPSGMRTPQLLKFLDCKRLASPCG